MKKALIFDLDGTLWDSAKQVVLAWNEVFAKRGTGIVIDEAIMMSYMGKPMSDIIAGMAPDMEVNAREDLLAACCEEEQKRLEQYGGILFPHLEETLAMLKEDYPMAVVSNCQAGYIETFVRYHKLEAYFQDMECPGNTGKLKADNIRLVMQRNHWDTAIYIGDTQGDLDASREAGIPFIFARYGFGQVDDESLAIDSIAELPELLKELGVS